MQKTLQYYSRDSLTIIFIYFFIIIYIYMYLYCKVNHLHRCMFSSLMSLLVKL